MGLNWFNLNRINPIKPCAPYHLGHRANAVTRWLLALISCQSESQLTLPCSVAAAALARRICAIWLRPKSWLRCFLPLRLYNSFSLSLSLSLPHFVSLLISLHIYRISLMAINVHDTSSSFLPSLTPALFHSRLKTYPSLSHHIHFWYLTPGLPSQT